MKLNEILSHWQEWWWLALLAFLVGAIPSWWPIIKEWRSQPFRFQAISGFHGRGAFVQWTRWPEGWRQNPIDVALYIRITNADTRGRGISGYELEVETADGWLRLERLELVPSPILEFRALPDAEWSRIDFTSNNLNARVRAGVVEPGQSIEGWAFFTGPGDPSFLRSLHRLRLTVFDTLGKRSRLTGPLPDERNAGTSMGLASLRVLPPNWTPPWRGGIEPPPPPTP